MSFVQTLLLNVPPLVLGTVIVAISIVFSILGLLLVRRFISHQKLKLHNDVAGFMFATLGVIYAVLLAFTVIIVWESFDEAQTNVEMEANYLVDLYTDSLAFPEPLRQELYSKFNDYAQLMIDEEWEMLGMGKTSPKVYEVVKDIWKLYSGYLPKTETEKIFLQESVEKLNKFAELRRLRYLESKTGVNPLLWFVLITGGVITVAFTFFFGTENFNAQMGMTILLAVTIALILFTILEFDYPFTGTVSVSPDAFKEIINAKGLLQNIIER